MRAMAAVGLLVLLTQGAARADEPAPSTPAVAAPPSLPVSATPGGPPAPVTELGANFGVAASPTLHPLTLPRHVAPAPDRPLLSRPLSSQAAEVAEAERLLHSNSLAAAANVIRLVDTPAAALVAARVYIGTGNQAAAATALERAAASPELAPYVALEQGRLALLAGRAGEAVGWLTPLYRSHHAFAREASLPLASALLEVRPAELLLRRQELGRHLPQDSARAKSLLAGLLATAERRLGQEDRACAAEVARFVAWPMVPETPATPPACRPLAADEWLTRIDALVEANRNEAAEQSLQSLRQAKLPPLSPEAACRLAFYSGVVARKQHRYKAAEEALGEAAERCHDPHLKRRALFTQAKVISIQDGLRALGPIDAFVKRYAKHSMADDALFWAGDSLQRRGRDAEASVYFRRILALPNADDFRAEAAWRLAWMAYRRHDLKAAAHALERSLTGQPAGEPWTRARAHYWLGRIAEAQHRQAQALAHYQEARRVVPLHFYAQQALGRALAIAPPTEHRLLAAAYGAERLGEPTRPPCPRFLADSPLLAEALYLRDQGLLMEARVQLLALARTLGRWPKDTEVAGAPARARARAEGDGRHQSEARLVLVMLLDQAHAHAQAKQRLEHDFAGALSRLPNAATAAIWRQAYPLAFREPLARAEAESGLPPYLLQALAREESGFDAEVVSWAEAAGLTQLLLRSGQQAGRTLNPVVEVPSLEVLLEPHINARLGGALLGLFGRQLAGNWPLALAAYNGGFETAKTWSQRFAGEELAAFAEEMTVRETRMYVQRVLQTYGIYRWLYAKAPPLLPPDARLPGARAVSPAKRAASSG